MGPFSLIKRSILNLNALFINKKRLNFHLETLQINTQ